MRIYYIVMKILFAAISIVAAAAAVAFAVLAAAKRRKAHVFQAAVCCCILAISAAGWCFIPPRSPVGGTGEVHVTVATVSGEPATIPSEAPPSPAAAQGAYTASTKSDKFHLPHCSSASRISDDNRVWFQTRDEAIAAGYSPCGKCDP